jgi:hypothetical protein
MGIARDVSLVLSITKDDTGAAINLEDQFGKSLGICPQVIDKLIAEAEKDHIIFEKIVTEADASATVYLLHTVENSSRYSIFLAL